MPVVEPLPFDAAIILGAAVRPDGSPSPALVRRVLHGVELARRNPSLILLMSGGAVSHSIPEAIIMREVAVAHGIAPQRVMTEQQSCNTIQNARQCKVIAAAMGWRRLVVVTDSYHLLRARYIFRRLGLKVAGSGARPADGGGAEWRLAHLREAAALPWTVFRVETAKICGNF